MTGPKATRQAVLLVLLVTACAPGCGPDHVPVSQSVLPLVSDAGLAADGFVVTLDAGGPNLPLVTVYGNGKLGAKALKIVVKPGGAITVQKGQWFLPKSGPVQPLMAQKSATITTAGTHYLPALCMKKGLNIPKKSSEFFSKPKEPMTVLQKCQKACGNDQKCIWKCQPTAPPPMADLKITTLALPHSGKVAPDYTFTGKYRINNAGNKTAKTDFEVKYEYCVSGKPCVMLGQELVTKDLAPGAAYTLVSITLSLPASVPSGLVFIRATVDASNRIKDSNGANNTSAAQVTIAPQKTTQTPDAAVFAEPDLGADLVGNLEADAAVPQTDWRTAREAPVVGPAWSQTRPGAGCSMGEGSPAAPAAILSLLLLYFVRLGRRRARRSR